ncbi:hypothetical protein K435DRAFT_727853 [Dendrothele bispora CBS 962.96]|uniref:Uncharacterized protein n=1 Tax=Dendrothele bispora (strain CBS 962.96) TaxID=1314807 RepID=A0A4S8LNV6_DENBC|nr:hypothetical protein K435DRAFT_727853 [Dendrothele bispora CBS 962.96]
MSSSNPLDSLPPELAQIIRLAITGFIQSQLPSIHIIIVASLWLGVSFCLFMALLYSSTPKSRRKPLFAFSVIAVGFGTVPSILFLKLLVDSFVKALSITETNEIKPYIFALSFFSYFSSICVDSILLFRLMAVFPPSRLSPRKLAMIFGPLLAMKLGRIATVIALVIKFIQKSQTVSNGDLINLYTAASELPEPRAAWVLQLVDNGICSFLFLYKLNQVQSFSARFGSNSSYLQLLRTLFLIAISNFVFPVIFAILQIIFISLKLSYESLASINISGTNIEIIGVLFATSMFRKTHFPRVPLFYLKSNSMIELARD